MAVSIGIDLGGTNTRLGLLVDAELHHSYGFPTRSFRGRDSILQDLVNAVLTMKDQAASDGLKLQCLGIGVPATIDMQKGQTFIMPNFAEGWYGFGLTDYLTQATGLTTYLINDARAFVLAEATLGAGQAFDDVFGIILGTGVGGGMVLAGALRFGYGALAGEIGHHIVEPFGVSCGCGSTGCLETVASAPALVASVTRAYLHGRSPVLLELTKGELTAVDAKTISEAARQGDSACLEALRRVGHYLGIATANVMTLIAPQCIVVGGGLAAASDLLFPAIQATWDKHLQVVGAYQPRLKLATLEQAGVTGAALHALNQEALTS